MNLVVRPSYITDEEIREWNPNPVSAFIVSWRRYTDKQKDPENCHQHHQSDDSGGHKSSDKGPARLGLEGLPEAFSEEVISNMRPEFQ